MAARKLQQEVDKCFKKVAEGVAEFEAIYDKIEQSNNPAQKEKLEDNLKREIKKLQRLRDQIKTWAASNDIKDKAPLLEHRKLIETQMEKFKAVEKAMKTKAYSKEGLSAAAKLDPKEQAKVEAGEFLSNMVDDLEQQIESLEAESESIQATMKKGKGQSAKAERMAEIDRVIERHKWHQGKLELIRRSLENGAVETEQVNEMEENIRYYVSDNMNDDFMEDEGIYDELDLEDEEGTYGMVQENEKSSSQDAQSVQDEVMPEPELSSKPSRKVPKEIDASARKASSQTRSPLPALATLHTPLSSTSTGGVANPSMKASCCACKTSRRGSQYCTVAATARIQRGDITSAASPAKNKCDKFPSYCSGTASNRLRIEGPAPPAEPEISIMTRPSKKKGPGKQPAVAQHAEGSTAQANGTTNGIKPIVEETEESIYHLPSSLQDLVDLMKHQENGHCTHLLSLHCD
ncbi:general negative regulator of transcription subunit 5 [Metarhizium acridum]|nr:general negative regulator of transcription subunit 5 [Metarhizium acridum]